MKKLVLLSVSFLAVLAMVTAASAATTQKSLGTSAAGDGWKVEAFGDGYGLVEGPIDSSWIPPTSATLYSDFQLSKNDVGKHYYASPYHPNWKAQQDHPNVSWVGPDLGSAQKVPVGAYAFTISLGDFADGDIWSISGFLSTDNSLMGAFVWSMAGIDSPLDLTGSLLASAPGVGKVNSYESPHFLAEPLEFGKLIDGEEYYLTLVVMNTEAGHVNWPNPAGLFSGLYVDKVSEKSPPRNRQRF